jgi:hypothetical protein
MIKPGSIAEALSYMESEHVAEKERWQMLAFVLREFGKAFEIDIYDEIKNPAEE